MYIKSQTVRKPNGRSYTYYHLVESYRENSSVKHRVIANLGALSCEQASKLAKRFAEIAGERTLTNEQDEIEVNGLKYFGAPLLVEHLLDHIGLGQIIAKESKKRRVSFDVVNALKVMLCAHLFKSNSKAELSVWNWQQKLFWHPHIVADLEYQHFLRSLNVLREMKDEVEKELFARLLTLFDLTVDLVLYDLTSSYVEGHASWSEILQRGYSRDKRKDCKQVVIGLVVTREGFPVTFRVFEGNRLDKKTLDEMVADLGKRFRIKRCIWVSDAGLLSEENLKLLKDHEYILGGGGSESRKDVKYAISQSEQLPGQEYAGVKMWEISLPEEQRAIPEASRVIVIDSAGRKEKTSAIFKRRLEIVREGLRNVEKQVAKGKYVSQEDIRVEAEKVLHNSRVKKYFTIDAQQGCFTWTEDEEAVAKRLERAGKYGLVVNTKLEPQEILSAYRTLLVVEEIFRVLKSLLDMRPFWHKCDENIEGHVVVSIWSYLLYKTLGVKLTSSKLSITSEQALQIIKEVRAVELDIDGKPVWKLMKLNAEAKEIFEAVGIKDVKGRFAQWAAKAPAYQYEHRTIKA